MIGEISRDEVRSSIEDKLCAHFSVTSASATDDQVFQATAIVINEIMSRLLAAESPTKHEKEVHYMSMEFLMGRSLMTIKQPFSTGDNVVFAAVVLAILPVLIVFLIGQKWIVKSMTHVGVKG